MVIRVPLSSGLLLLVELEGEEMTNACIVFGSEGDGGEVLVVVIMATY